MPLDQFLKIYHKLPHSDTYRIMDHAKYGDLSMVQLYGDIHRLGEQMRPIQEKRDRLLAIAERHWIDTGVL
jgi:hypothetical protein